MTQAAANFVEHVIPRVPARAWVLALPIPMRLLPASQPKSLTLVLQVVQEVLTRFLLERARVHAAAH